MEIYNPSVSHSTRATDANFLPGAYRCRFMAGGPIVVDVVCDWRDDENEVASLARTWEHCGLHGVESSHQRERGNGESVVHTETGRDVHILCVFVRTSVLYIQGGTVRLGKKLERWKRHQGPNRQRHDNVHSGQ